MQLLLSTMVVGALTAAALFASWQAPQGLRVSHVTPSFPITPPSPAPNNRFITAQANAYPPSSMPTSCTGYAVSGYCADPGTYTASTGMYANNDASSLITSRGLTEMDCTLTANANYRCCSVIRAAFRELSSSGWYDASSTTTRSSTIRCYADATSTLQFARLTSTALPNHPFSAPTQPKVANIDTLIIANPSFAGENTRAAQTTSSSYTLDLGIVGYSLSGVPFYSPWSAARVDALGGTEQLDLCEGHPDPNFKFHYHSAPTCMWGYTNPTCSKTHTSTSTTDSSSTTSCVGNTNW